MPAAAAGGEPAFKIVLDFTASVLHAVAWPVALVFIVLLFRRQIVGLIPQLQEASFLGTNWKFQKQEAEAAIMAAPANAAASKLLANLPGGPPERIGRMVHTWNGIEAWLRQRVSPPGLDPAPPVTMLIRAGLQEGVLTTEQAQGLRGLYAMRNLAVHGRASDISEARVKEFLTIALAIRVLLGIPDQEDDE
jgi:hypothetical protein